MQLFEKFIFFFELFRVSMNIYEHPFNIEINLKKIVSQVVEQKKSLEC